MNLRLLIFSLCFVFAIALQAGFETKPLTEKQLKTHKLEGKFFKKGTEVEGILIATSDRVSDYAHAESAYLFGKIMQSIDKKVADRIREKRVLCILIGHDELTSDVPQFRTKKGQGIEIFTIGEAGAFCVGSGRVRWLSLRRGRDGIRGRHETGEHLIHELGHLIHGAGFDDLTEARRRPSRRRGSWESGTTGGRLSVSGG